MFKEIQPAPKSLKGSATFKENREGGILMVTEFPGDTISISFPFSSGPSIKGEGSKWIPAVFTKLNDKILPTQDIPGGDESIHRYTGIVPVGVNVDYIFSGEPGISDHLTFVLIKDIGYVYLRGIGVVFLLQEGKVVKAIRCIKGACEVVE